MEDLNDKLLEILEVDEINPEDILIDFELWDSLTILSIIAMLDEDYKITLSAEELEECKTIADLDNLISERKK